jgi:hypothetical protein
MHSQLAGGAALVALVFFQHGRDEAPLEFAHCLGIENIAVVHLLYECFELIFHGGLFSYVVWVNVSSQPLACNSSYFAAEPAGVVAGFCALRT